MTYPNTYIHPDAQIGQHVQIDPFSYIAADVQIGDHTWIGPNVTIMDGARIGSHCRIFPGAVVAAIPQDLKFDGEQTTVVIGDHTTVREFVTINRGTKDRYQTRIGNHVLLMAYVHVAHDCIIGDHCILANTVQLGGHVVIGDYVVMGGTSAAHQFVHIGDHAMIAGGGRVRKDVPPFITVAREPLSFVGVNVTGLRRRNFDKQQLNNIHEIYRLLYSSGLNTQEALQRIEDQLPDSSERQRIFAFIKSSSRGIVRSRDAEEEDKVDVF
ncbi:MAG: acyl-ACP--UDP-N-acetylglucosamine O-acyltransferase [Bernardetiaceae bacterium]